jgi:hypothetical protein
MAVFEGRAWRGLIAVPDGPPRPLAYSEDRVGGFEEGSERAQRTAAGEPRIEAIVRG